MQLQFALAVPIHRRSLAVPSPFPRRSLAVPSPFPRRSLAVPSPFRLTPRPELRVVYGRTAARRGAGDTWAALSPGAVTLGTPTTAYRTV